MQRLPYAEGAFCRLELWSLVAVVLGNAEGADYLLQCWSALNRRMAMVRSGLWMQLARSMSVLAGTLPSPAQQQSAADAPTSYGGGS